SSSELSSADAFLLDVGMYVLAGLPLPIRGTLRTNTNTLGRVLGNMHHGARMGWETISNYARNNKRSVGTTGISGAAGVGMAKVAALAGLGVAGVGLSVATVGIPIAAAIVVGAGGAGFMTYRKTKRIDEARAAIEAQVVKGEPIDVDILFKVVSGGALGS